MKDAGHTAEQIPISLTIDGQSIATPLTLRENDSICEGL